MKRDDAKLDAKCAGEEVLDHYANLMDWSDMVDGEAATKVTVDVLYSLVEQCMGAAIDHLLKGHHLDDLRRREP